MSETPTDVRSDEKLQENVKWKLHVRNSVSRRLESRKKNPVMRAISEAMTTRLGLSESMSSDFSNRRRHPAPTVGLEWFVETTFFHYVCAVLIIANALFIGFHTEEAKMPNRFGSVL